METAMGKVYRKDGKYLVRSESHTHTGFHTRFEWVDDVNLATVFYGEHGPRLHMVIEATAGADALDATETRTVTIAPYDKMTIGSIVQLTETGVEQQINFMGEITRRFVEVSQQQMEAGLRKKLIELGWTPPGAMALINE